MLSQSHRQRTNHLTLSSATHSATDWFAIGCCKGVMHHSTTPLVCCWASARSCARGHPLLSSATLDEESSSSFATAMNNAIRHREDASSGLHPVKTRSNARKGASATETKVPLDVDPALVPVNPVRPQSINRARPPDATQIALLPSVAVDAASLIQVHPALACSRPSSCLFDGVAPANAPAK